MPRQRVTLLLTDEAVEFVDDFAGCMCYGRSKSVEVMIQTFKSINDARLEERRRAKAKAVESIEVSGAVSDRCESKAP